MDADCHEEEEVAAVSDWMDCTKLLLEAQHLWETVSLCVVFQIICIGSSVIAASDQRVICILTNKM